MQLADIKDAIVKQITDDLDRCGLMYRVFARVKTQRSLAHKMKWKGDKYRANGTKMQDIIGIRVVLYFPEDVELLGIFFSCRDLVDASVDSPRVDEFRPKRLNLVKPIPEELLEGFHEALPTEFADYIDATYEVQIRTIFSEGWHEIEHDMRYKCKEDWVGLDSSSRALNGVIATLETAEWSLSAIFREMSSANYESGNIRAMLRNKMLIRMIDNDFSPRIKDYLQSHPTLVHNFFKTDRMVFLITLLSHKAPLSLTYDNILFLVNRYDLMDAELSALEDEETSAKIDAFLAS